MPVCIVRGCATTSKKKPYDIMLHSFPKEKELIRLWLKQMNQNFGDLEEFAEKVFTSARGNYRICSLHFTRNAYEKRGYSIFLKKDAIPTMFPGSAAIWPPEKKSCPALSSELHTEHASSLTDIQPPIRPTIVDNCQHVMTTQVQIKTEDERSSSGLFNTELHMVPIVPTATLLLPKQETLVELSHPVPVMASQIHIKTEEETLSISELNRARIAPLSNIQLPKQDVVGGLKQDNLVPRHTQIKTEYQASSTILPTELHTLHSVPPISTVASEQETEVGICPDTTGIPLKLHIKTEDETLGGFITTEIKPVHVMPATGQPQKSTSARPQKRKRLCAPKRIKTIGTITGYYPGQVHKSIQFDRSMGAKHRSFQVRMRPFHNSLGIQCDLVKLPSLKTIAQSQTNCDSLKKKPQDLHMTLGHSGSIHTRCGSAPM
ncbi:U4/U6 small nuclear ribonucleoprotein Prp4 isoform 2-T3 [Mantella aurantiaca]